MKQRKSVWQEVMDLPKLARQSRYERRHGKEAMEAHRRIRAERKRAVRLRRLLDLRLVRFSHKGR